MLLQFKREEFLKPLFFATAFVEAKNSMPMLANVVINKTGDKITFTAANIDAEINQIIDSPFAGEDFSIAIDAKKLYSILNAFPEGAIINMNYMANLAESDDRRISFTSNKLKFYVQSLDGNRFPRIRLSDSYPQEINISQKQLKRMISKIVYAAAEKDSRIFLNGVYFEIKHGQFRLVATDAHRLGFASYLVDNSGDNFGIIVPKKTLLEIIKPLDESSDTNVRLSLAQNQVIFNFNNLQIISKVIDGKYPEYERVIPTSNTLLCLVNRQNLLKTIEKVALITSNSNGASAVTFTIENDTLTVLGGNEDQEEAIIETSLEHSVDFKIKITFNIAYAKEMLVNSHAEHLQFAFQDEQRSVLITNPLDSEFKAVLMPLRV